MNIFIGKDINLGLFFARNNRPLTGQTITVKVIDQNGGAQILADTTVVETSEPGVYNFLWQTVNPTPPPNTETDLIALFKSRFKTFTQSISLIKKSEAGGVRGEFVATIEKRQLSASINKTAVLIATAE